MGARGEGDQAEPGAEISTDTSSLVAQWQRVTTRHGRATSRPSRLGWHRASLSEIAGSSPAMTVIVCGTSLAPSPAALLRHPVEGYSKPEPLINRALGAARGE